MASAQELQSLLRFLSQDAKVPLAQALGKVKDLQAARLATRKHVRAYNRDESSLTMHV